MTFAKTALLQHPLVEQAYDLVRKAIGLKHEDAKSALASSALYARHVAPAKPEVAAALLFYNHAYPQVETIGGKVEDLASFAIEMSGLERIPDPQGDADRSNIMLAQAVGHAQELEKEISGAGFYIYNVMQNRLARLQQLIDIAAQAGAPALAAVAQQETDKALDAQKHRNDGVAKASTFAKSGLPAHPLVERAYDELRDYYIAINPHSKDQIDFGVAIAKCLVEHVEHVEPEMLAAAMLNQICAKPSDLALRYNARTAELHAATSVLGPDDLPPVEGADNIRAAIKLDVLRNWLVHLRAKPTKNDEDMLYDIERLSASALELADGGTLAPALAAVLRQAANEGEARIKAPAAVAVRKPGTPPPDYGW